MIFDLVRAVTEGSAALMADIIQWQCQGGRRLRLRVSG